MILFYLLLFFRIFELKTETVHLGFFFLIEYFLLCLPHTTGGTTTTRKISGITLIVNHVVGLIWPIIFLAKSTVLTFIWEIVLRALSSRMAFSFSGDTSIAVLADALTISFTLVFWLIEHVFYLDMLKLLHKFDPVIGYKISGNELVVLTWYDQGENVKQDAT